MMNSKIYISRLFIFAMPIVTSCYAFVTPIANTLIPCDSHKISPSHGVSSLADYFTHHRCTRSNHHFRYISSADSRSGSHSLKSPPSSTDLTVILPAYNEELRIEESISKYASYLKSQMKSKCLRCSILVVDDGSDDGTCDVVQRCARTLTDGRIGADFGIKLVSLQQNEGKGFAVAKGLFAVQDDVLQRKNSGDLDVDHIWQIVLVADADGSGDIEFLDGMITKFSSLLIDISNFENTNTNDTLPSRGTTAMLVGNRDGNTSLSRVITRWGFRTVVKIICGDLQVDDTQCGFKLMTLDAGMLLYSDLNLRRWTHDVEVLYRAKQLGVPVIEMKIGWEDKAGSKLASTLWETISISAVMLMEVLFMRINYGFGRWSVPRDK